MHQVGSTLSYGFYINISMNISDSKIYTDEFTYVPLMSSILMLPTRFAHDDTLITLE